jgi:hypothetical protein
MVDDLLMISRLKDCAIRLAIGALGYLLNAPIMIATMR